MTDPTARREAEDRSERAVCELVVGALRFVAAQIHHAITTLDVRKTHTILLTGLTHGRSVVGWQSASASATFAIT